MNFHAIGDLAQFMTARRHNVGLQSRLADLTKEMSTGEVADVSRRVNGSFGQLSDIEHRIAVAAAQKTAGKEASVQAAAMQTALEMVQTQLTDISDLALLAGGGVDGPQLDAAATGARAALDAIVSALNTSVSGRPLFSGSDLNSSPLPGSEALMGSVRSALIGATDAAAVRAALDGFFDSPGGGFDAAVYRGGNQDLAAVDLGAGESVRLSLRADDAALRSALKNTVIAALAGDAAITLGRGDRVALMQEAGRALLSDIDAVTGIRSDLGFAEARIDRAVARSSAEQTSLSMMRNEVMSVDLFETASALEQLQLQLETFYTVTARTSRLNLVNFL